MKVSALFFMLAFSMMGNQSIPFSAFTITEKVLEKGDQAPGFTLPDSSGQTVSLSDFKGKVIYLDIWASWCAPCLLQMKYAETLKEHFKDNPDVVFLYISIDQDKQKWLNALQKRHLKGVHLHSKNGEDQNIVRNYDVPSIPRFVLIDKEGKIAYPKAKAPSDKGAVRQIESLL